MKLKQIIKKGFKGFFHPQNIGIIFILTLYLTYQYLICESWSCLGFVILFVTALITLPIFFVINMIFTQDNWWKRLVFFVLSFVIAFFVFYMYVMR